MKLPMKRMDAVVLLGCALAVPAAFGSTYYVVERNAGQVWGVQSSSGAAQVVASGLGEMIGVAVDRRGRLFVSQFHGLDPARGTVAQVDLGSGGVSRIDGTEEVFALSADPDADVLYAGGYNTGLLYRLEETSPGVWQVSTEVDLGAPKRVSHALKDGHFLYVACQDSGVWVKDLLTGNLTYGVDIPLQATTMAREVGGHLIVGSEWGTVYRVDPVTWQVVRTYTGFDGACGIAVDPSDNSVLVADPYRRRISRLNLVTGDVVTVTTMPVEPWQIICAPEHPGPVRDFSYTSNGVTIAITQYTGSGGVVTIPETIDGLPVVRLADSTFAGCATLTSVVLSTNLTDIGAEAFAACSGLTNVLIPDSVSSIGPFAFRGCTRLTAIQVGASNAGYTSTEGVLLDLTGTTLIVCPGGKGGSYVVPAGVVSIEGKAFEACGRLEEVSLPGSVRTIGDAAFLGCTNLARVTISEGVTSIGDAAFRLCRSLAVAQLPESIVSIGADAFGGCERLTSVTLSENLALVSSGAFAGCTSLTHVAIPAGVTTIGTQAFAGCVSLASVSLGAGLRNMAEDSFMLCRSLNTMTVDELNSSFSTSEGVLFRDGQTWLMRCPPSKAGTYSIPGGVTRIASWAFDGCSGLRSVIAPDSIDVIAGLAFLSCSNLSAVYFMGDAPLGSTTAGPVFSDSYPTVFHLPEATNWTSTFRDRPTALWRPQLRSVESGSGTRTNGFRLGVGWADGRVVVVEACTNLAAPLWIPLQTNTLAGGAFDFLDSDWAKHSTRFYRVSSP